VLEAKQRLIKTYGAINVVKSAYCKVGERKTGGVMFLSRDWLFFLGKSFGLRKDIKLFLKSIQLITKEKEKNKGKKFAIKIDELVFGGFDEPQEIFSVLKELWTQAKITKSTHNEQQIQETQDLLASFSQDEKIWEELLRGSVTHSYTKDQIIVQQGTKQTPKLYNITSGTCIVRSKPKIKELEKEKEEKHENKEAKNKYGKVLEIMQPGTVFGEVEFILGHASPITVIAGSDDTTITSIDAYYINVLFQHSPHVAGRLYYQLGQVLLKRIQLAKHDATSENSEISETQ